MKNSVIAIVVFIFVVLFSGMFIRNYAVSKIQADASEELYFALAGTADQEYSQSDLEFLADNAGLKCTPNQDYAYRHFVHKKCQCKAAKTELICVLVLCVLASGFGIWLLGKEE